MRRTVYLSGIIGVICFLVSCSTSDSGKTLQPSNKWSSNQGKMNWTGAKVKCASLGMKLPTVQEFAEAEKNGTTKSWEQKGYWTAAEASDNYAYSFNVLDRNIVGNDKNFHWRVICLR